jgi:hypothetical protein
LRIYLNILYVPDKHINYFQIILKCRVWRARAHSQELYLSKNELNYLNRIMFLFQIHMRILTIFVKK